MAIGVSGSFAELGKRNINTAVNRLGGNLSRLSSGKAINKAADNAAGLAIAEQLQADIRSVNQAQRNISDGRSLLRVAEGAQSTISDLLSRGRELSVQAATGTLNDKQRSTINNEITSIKQEIDRITTTSEFNGQKLNDGSLAAGSSNQVSVQAGFQNSSGDRISLNKIEDSSSAGIGISGVDVSTQAGAQAAIDSFDSAISTISANRANIGALENRFDIAARNASVTSENLAAAESRIRGLDVAAESSRFANNKTLVQASVSVLKSGLTSQAGIVGSLLNIRG